MEPNETNTEKRPLACEPSILSVAGGSAPVKCHKCDGEQTMTPICLNCGCIPIAELGFQELRDEIQRLRTGIACAANALTDSILCSGNDVDTNLHFVRKLKALLTLPNNRMSVTEK